MDTNPTTKLSYFKRRKIMIACNACRKSKQKCSNSEIDSRFPCKRCTEKGIPCVYEKNDRKTESFESHLEMIEASLHKIQQRRKPNAKSSSTSPASSRILTGTPSSNTADNMIQQLTQSVADITLHINNIEFPVLPQSPSLYPRMVKMPPVELQKRLVSLALNIRFRIVPLVQAENFMQRLGDESNPPHPGLVYALMAHGAKYTDDVSFCLDPEKMETMGVPFIEMAQRIAWAEVKKPSLATLQTLLLVAVFEDGTSRFSMAPIVTGATARMCFLLGLTREKTYARLSIQEKIEYRSAFILAWLIESAQSCSETIRLPFAFPEGSYDTQLRFGHEELEELPELKYLEIFADIFRTRRSLWLARFDRWRDEEPGPISQQEFTGALQQIERIRNRLPPLPPFDPYHPEVDTMPNTPSDIAQWALPLHLMNDFTSLEACRLRAGEGVPPTVYERVMAEAACRITTTMTLLDDRRYYNLTFNLVVTASLAAARAHLHTALGESSESWIGFLWLMRNLRALSSTLAWATTLAGQDVRLRVVNNSLKVCKAVAERFYPPNMPMPNFPGGSPPSGPQTSSSLPLPSSMSPMQAFVGGMQMPSSLQQNSVPTLSPASSSSHPPYLPNAATSFMPMPSALPLGSSSASVIPPASAPSSPPWGSVLHTIPQKSVSPAASSISTNTNSPPTNSHSIPSSTMSDPASHPLTQPSSTQPPPPLSQSPLLHSMQSHLKEWSHGDLNASLALLLTPGPGFDESQYEIPSLVTSFPVTSSDSSSPFVVENTGACEGNDNGLSGKKPGVEEPVPDLDPNMGVVDWNMFWQS
ncbi:uncharacterized protein VTP21DRAFT_3783 [Calcarisporiella thermophila]|uniref:uncharacterized protein n=1 Tax=Calcarisporiella thermophila TaxID=911321 RepID=UPI0037441803